MATLLFYLVQAFRIYQFLMIIWVFSSWFPQARETGILQFCGRLVDPYLKVFRQVIPNFGGLDLSPLVAFWVLDWGIRNLITLIVRM